MADDIDNIMRLITENYLLILGFLVLVALLWFWRNYKPKSQVKPVNRAEVERANFLSRMNFNDSFYKRLIINNKPKFKIKKLQASEYKDGNQTIKIYEMVMTPLKLGLIPFGKDQGYVINADNISTSETKETDMILRMGATLWYRNGVYVDNSFSKDLIKWFNREYSAQTDLENTLSMYYSSAQEASVIDLDRANTALQKHLDVELEKEKRRKMQMGI